MGIKTLCSFLYSNCGVKSFGERSCSVGYSGTPGVNSRGTPFLSEHNLSWTGFKRYKSVGYSKKHWNWNDRRFDNQSCVPRDPTEQLVSSKSSQDVRLIDRPGSGCRTTGSGITHISFQSLSGKTVVIDTSIYLYKFAGVDSLIPNMYLFITLLRQCNITPIFIFDGRPSDAKYEVVKRRREAKRLALEKFYAMREDQTVNKQSLSRVRKQCVYLNKQHFTNVKELMTACGVAYYTAVTESDPLCAYLVRTGKAWACISDDMDMFAYGCTRVIRHANIIDGTATLFDLDVILEQLNTTLCDFRQATLLCENDQNVAGYLPWKSMHDIWLLVADYYRSSNKDTNKDTNTKTVLPIYDWLLSTGKIQSEQHELLYKTYQSMCTESEDFQRMIQIELATHYGESCAPLIIQQQTVVPIVDSEPKAVDSEPIVDSEPKVVDSEPTDVLVKTTKLPITVYPIHSNFTGIYDRERVREIMKEVGVVIG